jgi:hypothetical protein
LYIHLLKDFSFAKTAKEKRLKYLSISQALNLRIHCFSAFSSCCFPLLFWLFVCFMALACMAWTCLFCLLFFCLRLYFLLGFGALFWFLFFITLTAFWMIRVKQQPSTAPRVLLKTSSNLHTGLCAGSAGSARLLLKTVLLLWLF